MNRFTHRILSGWTTDLVGRPVDAPGRPEAGIWPAPRMDDDQLPDLIACLEICAASGYTGQIVWGLFTDRDWNPDDVGSCVEGGQGARVEALLSAAKTVNVAVYAGVGVLSWGFEQIIRARPALAPTNNRVLCPCLSESWEWMERVLDAYSRFAFAGYDLQSADQGRCDCETCTARFPTGAAYHAFVIGEVARRIRTRTPDALLIFDNWGCPFGADADLPDLVALAAHVDILLDHDGSASQSKRGRAAFVAATAKPYGTLAGCGVWNPRRRDPATYFLPSTVVNVPYLRPLARDGGSVAMPFAFPWHNPSGEISLRFAGRVAQNPFADADTLLAEVCGETFGVAGTDAQVVAASVRAVEEAFLFADETDDPREHLSRYGDPVVCLISVGGGFEDASDPPSHAYLSGYDAPRRERIRTAASQAIRVMGDVYGTATRTDRLTAAVRGLQHVLRDLNAAQAVPVRNASE